MQDSPQEHPTAHGAPGAAPPSAGAQAGDRPSPFDDPGRTPYGDPSEYGGSSELAMARTWVQENQTVALAAAFVLGTVVGFGMRH